MTREEVLQEIKLKVIEILPDAKVLLFGSRASSTEHEESDWDILILTNEQVNHELKFLIHDYVFPVSMKAEAFIQTLVINKNDWENSPSYYSLNKSVNSNPVLEL